jgi:hypothetical protein
MGLILQPEASVSGTGLQPISGAIGYYIGRVAGPRIRFKQVLPARNIGARGFGGSRPTWITLC